MNLENSGDKNAPDKKTIIVDLEHMFHHGGNHPEEGEIVLYRIKVDNNYHNVEHRLRTGEQILALESKSARDFKLEQCWRTEDGQIVRMHILPEIIVDFKTPGIERFVTSPLIKEHTFFIGEKEYKTPSSHLTVRQILTDYAKVDVQKKTLAKKTATGVHEYKNLDESIPMEGCPRFTLLDDQSATVS